MRGKETKNEVATVRQNVAARQQEQTGGFRRDLSAIAVLFTFGSAMIRLTLAPIRAQEYLPYGLFLAAAAIVQLGLAVAVVRRPSRRRAVIGALLSAALIVATIVFQTVAWPIGPHPWQPVDFNEADETGIGANLLALVTLLVLAWRPTRRGRPGRSARVGYGAAVVATTLLTFVGIAIAVHATPVGLNMSAPVPASRAPITVTSLHEPPGNQPVRAATLVAEPSTVRGREVWTYSGSVPGPELRVTQGDRVRVTLVNHLPVATSIHWHGVSLPNAEDGVAGVTQDAVRPGASYTYEFVAKDAGTFMYHSHQDSFHQILQGLFGALVVEPRAGTGADRDYAVVVHAAPSGRTNLRDVLGELIVSAPGNTVPAVNGAIGTLHLAAKRGERVRLRLIGAIQGDMHVRHIPRMMHAGPQELVLLGTEYRVAALDGHELTGPQPIGPQRLRLGIGQRYDLVFTMPAQGAVRLVDATGGETVVIGEGSLPPTPDLAHLPVFDLTAYGTPRLTPSRRPGPMSASK